MIGMIGRISLISALLLFSTSLYAQIDWSKKDRTTGKYGFVDEKGKWIVAPQYDNAKYHLVGEYGEVWKGDKEGIVNNMGKLVVPCAYKSIYVSGEFAAVTDFNDKVGVFNMRGMMVVPCQYKEVYCSSDGIKVTDFNGNVGKRHTLGSVLLPCKYKSIGYDSGRFIAATTHANKTEVVRNSDGKVVCVLPRAYKMVHLPYTGDLDAFKVETLNGKYNACDAKGKELLPRDFDEVSVDTRLSEIKVKENGRCGIYNLAGKELVRCDYDMIRNIGDGMYIVVKGGSRVNGSWVGGKWGYYHEGKEIVPLQYDEASEFRNDVATVKKDGQVSLLKNPLKDQSTILVAENASAAKRKGGQAVSRYPAPDSDIDKNIPQGKSANGGNEFAFIIANENYPDAPVPYALNDGRTFKQYCLKTLGLPSKNVFVYEDATYGTIVSAVEKMKSIASAFDGEASIVIYYAGHGVPDEKNSSAFILPVDGNASDIETTGYSLAKFYKQISALQLKNVTVFLDACFSGAKREDEMLIAGRGVAIKVKDEVPQGKMVVFSASTGDETAHQLEEKRHGLFTYFLLKKIQETGGDVTFGDLSDYVTKQVKRHSVVINNKKQTPTVIPAPAVASSWRGITLK